MNWFQSQSDTDATIQNSQYGGLASEADGIDLRIEMNRILYGSSVSKPLGHWVVIRHFNRAKHTSNWNSFNKEAVGGPAFEYTDKLVRARYVSPKANNLNTIKSSEILDNTAVFYFEYTEIITENDFIYELELLDNKTKPTEYNLRERFIVKDVNAYRLENGNIQYFAAYVERDNIKY